MGKTVFAEGTPVEPSHANGWNSPKYRRNPQNDGEISYPPVNGFRNPGCRFDGPLWLWPKFTDELSFVPGIDLPLRQLGLCIDKNSNHPGGSVDSNNGYLRVHNFLPGSSIVIHGELGSRFLGLEDGIVTIQVAFKMSSMYGKNFRFTIECPEIDNGPTFFKNYFTLLSEVVSVDSPADRVVLHKSWRFQRTSDDMNHYHLPIPRLKIQSTDSSATQLVGLSDLHWGSYQHEFDPSELDSNFDYTDVEPIIPSLLALLGKNMPILPTPGVSQVIGHFAGQPTQGTTIHNAFIPFDRVLDCISVEASAKGIPLPYAIWATGELPSSVECGIKVLKVTKTGFWASFSHSLGSDYPIGFEVSWIAS